MADADSNQPMLQRTPQRFDVTLRRAIECQIICQTNRVLENSTDLDDYAKTAPSQRPNGQRIYLRVLVDGRHKRPETLNYSMAFLQIPGQTLSGVLLLELVEELVNVFWAADARDLGPVFCGDSTTEVV